MNNTTRYYADMTGLRAEAQYWNSLRLFACLNPMEITNLEGSIRAGSIPQTFHKQSGRSQE